MAMDTSSATAHESAKPPARSSARGRVRRWIRSIPVALALILFVGAIQSIAWNLAVPPFQGPDEENHFAYVQYLAETGHLPSAVVGNSPRSLELETALTILNLPALRGDLPARPAWSSADVTLWHETERTLPKGARADGSGANPQARNPPLYYAVMAIPYRAFVWLSLPKRLFVLRLFSALSYLATIALAWLIAGEVFGRVRWKQTVAAGVVALEPQLGFMSAIVNADSLLIALTTACLLAALRLVKRGPSTKRVLVASALTAAAVLTQGRGLVTVPILATAIITAWVRHRPAIRQGFIQGALATATMVVAIGGYYLFGKSSGGSSLYGGDLGSLNSGAGFSLRQFLSSIYQFYFPRLRSLQPRLGPEYGYRQVFIETFYGKFGWLEVNLPLHIYGILQVLSALGLLGFYTACVAHWRRLRQAWPTVAVMLSLLLTTVFFLHYVSYRALLQGPDPLIVGRYLLPMISLFGLAIAFTIGALPRRIGPLVGAVTLSLGVLLSLTSITITMVRFYA